MKPALLKSFKLLAKTHITSRNVKFILLFKINQNKIFYNLAITQIFSHNHTIYIFLLTGQQFYNKEHSLLAPLKFNTLRK